MIRRLPGITTRGRTRRGADPRVRRKRDEDSQRGFTLIELIVVIAIIPLVIGGIAAALLSVMTQQNNVASKVSDSQDTSIVAENFVQDVQGASQITTDSNVTSPIPCGTHTPILSLLWGSSPQVVVSYDVIQTGTGGSTYALYRDICTNGGSPTPTNIKVISHDVQSGLNFTSPIAGMNPIAGVSCQPGSLSCQPSAQTAANSGWAYTAGISGVTLAVNSRFQGDQTYNYSLVGVPRATTSASQGGSPPGHPTALSLSSSGTGVSCAGSSNAGITVNGTMQIDSTSSTVATTSGNASISADQIDTGSTSSSALQGSFDPSPPSQQGITVTDPFAGLAPPVTGLLTASLTPGGTYQGYNVYGSTYSGPGIYTGPGPLTFGNGTTTLASGVYVLMNGISLSGNQSIQSATTGGADGNGGVLLYNFRGIVSLSGNGTATISPFNIAPATYAGAPNPWPGITIWQDGVGGQGSTDPGDTNALALSGNGAGNLINGTVYAPSASAGTAGNGALTVGSIVSAGIACQGNGAFTIG